MKKKKGPEKIKGQDYIIKSSHEPEEGSGEMSVFQEIITTYIIFFFTAKGSGTLHFYLLKYS